MLYNDTLLENLDTGEQVQYQIVGPDESDVKQGKISSSSPVGLALMGKKVDDEVSVRTPGGMRNFMVIRISSAQENDPPFCRARFTSFFPNPPLALR